MTARRMYRQGDVLLLARTSPRPSTMTIVPRDEGRVILAYGEVTGHAHALAGEGLELWQSEGGNRVLVVDRPSDVTHEEHSTIRLDTLEFGYDVIIQREYTPEAIRNVLD